MAEYDLYHYGITGQKWGIRRFQYEDGTLTPEGKKRYKSKAMLRYTDKQMDLLDEEIRINKYKYGESSYKLANLFDSVGEDSDAIFEQIGTNTLYKKHSTLPDKIKQKLSDSQKIKFNEAIDALNNSIDSLNETERKIQDILELESVAIQNLNDYDLYHWGILGQKWGIRRFQYKDGTLTPAGRKRYLNSDGSLNSHGREKLKIDEYENEHDKDILLKKGTEVNRVISTDFYENWVLNDEKDKEKQLTYDELVKKSNNDAVKKDSQYERKYVSVDNVQNSGRIDGKSFYTSWFSDNGLFPEAMVLATYKLKNNVKVASGKQVLEELIKDVGNTKMTSLLEQNAYDIHTSLTREYTTDQDLFNRINSKFKNRGYDAVEDINDPDSDMPIIVFNSSKSLTKPTSIKSGKEAIQEVTQIHKNDKWSGE